MNLLLLLWFLFLPAKDAPQESKVEQLMQLTRDVAVQHAILIDMSIPSNEKRLFLINLSTGETEYATYVAHGKGSGQGLFPLLFSDEPGSNCTALGLYRIEEKYWGEHGCSYRLAGLQPSNSNAMKRSIVMHSAWYAEEDFIKENNRCGNSWGCPAVSEKALNDLAPYLVAGTLMYICK